MNVQVREDSDIESRQGVKKTAILGLFRLIRIRNIEVRTVKMVVTEI